MVQLSSSLLLAVAALSPLAAAWPKDTCHQPMYKDMWHYRNHEPAKEFCHKHNPEPTVTKTRYPGCVTKTINECHETTTVTHTRTIRCHTTHSKPPTSVYPVPYSQHTPRAAEAEAQPAALPVDAPAAATLAAAPEKREAWGGWGGQGHSWGGEAGHWGGEHGGWEGKPWGGWGNPWDGWNHKHEGMKHCGYDCVQKGCHCMRGGETKTHYTTAKPTCTKTSTRGYTKTVTKYETVSGYNCMHGGVHGYPNHRPGGYHPPGHYGKE